MAKYIDADKLLKKINEQKLMAREPAAKRTIGYINEAATEDVEPVRHGEWCEDDDDIICPLCQRHWNKCDNCTETFVYCPNCGAKMDGEDLEDDGQK